MKLEQTRIPSPEPRLQFRVSAQLRAGNIRNAQHNELEPLFAQHKPAAPLGPRDAPESITCQPDQCVTGSMARRLF